MSDPSTQTTLFTDIAICYLSFNAQRTTAPAGTKVPLKGLPALWTAPRGCEGVFFKPGINKHFRPGPGFIIDNPEFRTTLNKGNFTNGGSQLNIAQNAVNLFADQNIPQQARKVSFMETENM
jgi:hypothetical protein